MEGEYRSACYMRPLAIWAMQWALNQQKQKQKLLSNQEAEEITIIPKVMNEDSLLKEHTAFKRVARLLKIDKEEDSRGIVQLIFDYTCKRMVN